MKKVIALSALVMTFVTLTFGGVASAQVEELDGLMSAEELAQEMGVTDPSGMEDAEAFGHPVPVYPQPYPYPHHHYVTCYAKNIRGFVFAATGFNPSYVQEEALTSCRISSAVCKPAGCVRN